MIEVREGVRTFPCQQDTPRGRFISHLACDWRRCLQVWGHEQNGHSSGGVKRGAGGTLEDRHHDSINHFWEQNKTAAVITGKQACYCSRGQGVRLSSALIWVWFWFFCWNFAKTKPIYGCLIQRRKVRGCTRYATEMTCLRQLRKKDLRLGLSVGNSRTFWNQVKHLFTPTASRRSSEKNLQRHGDAEWDWPHVCMKWPFQSI